MPGQPTHDVCTKILNRVQTGPDGDKGAFFKIGAGWLEDDGNMSIELALLPQGATQLRLACFKRGTRTVPQQQSNGEGF